MFDSRSVTRCSSVGDLLQQLLALGVGRLRGRCRVERDVELQRLVGGDLDARAPEGRQAGRRRPVTL